MSVLQFYPAQVSSGGPAQDSCEAPLSIFYKGIYASGELWDYWRIAFPNMRLVDMFEFVGYDIDGEGSGFIQSLARRGSWPPA